MAPQTMYYECTACGKRGSELEDQWTSVADAEWEQLKTEWINAEPDAQRGFWKRLFRIRR